MDRATTCCFTGHRPDKLPWGSRESDPRCLTLKRRLTQAVEGAYTQGMRHFICGMARGTDLYFAEAVLALRLCRSGVTLEAARPCESQADAWPEAERHRYQAILDQCDFETLVQHRYDRFCMQRRNRYMVDRSALVLSVYDGVPKGGTAQTLAYAMRQGVPVQILADAYLLRPLRQPPHRRPAGGGHRAGRLLVQSQYPPLYRVPQPKNLPGGLRQGDLPPSGSSQ